MILTISNGLDVGGGWLEGKAQYEFQLQCRTPCAWAGPANSVVFTLAPAEGGEGEAGGHFRLSMGKFSVFELLLTGGPETREEEDDLRPR